MFVHQKPSLHKWQLGETWRRLSKHSSLLSFVPAVGSGCPPQMIELIHNYECFASSIYLLCPGEQSITPPLVFSKHHECLMAGNLLPTSNHPPNPYTCNTALIFCCFNTTTSSSHPWNTPGLWLNWLKRRFTQFQNSCFPGNHKFWKYWSIFLPVTD